MHLQITLHNPGAEDSVAAVLNKASLSFTKSGNSIETQIADPGVAKAVLADLTPIGGIQLQTVAPAAATPSSRQEDARRPGVTPRVPVR